VSTDEARILGRAQAQWLKRALTTGDVFFGHVRIDGRSGELEVTHCDLAGTVLHRLVLQPEG
jgi:hypothetical protein